MTNIINIDHIYCEITTGCIVRVMGIESGKVVIEVEEGSLYNTEALTEKEFDKEFEMID